MSVTILIKGYYSDTSDNYGLILWILIQSAFGNPCFFRFCQHVNWFVRAFIIAILCKKIMLMSEIVMWKQLDFGAYTEKLIRHKRFFNSLNTVVIRLHETRRRHWICQVKINFRVFQNIKYFSNEVNIKIYISRLSANKFNLRMKWR